MNKKRRRCWWDSITERQRQSRTRNGKEASNPAQRGQKEYLSNFSVGEIREYDGLYDWDNLRCTASRMNVFGSHFVFNTHKGIRYIIRVK